MIMSRCIVKGCTAGELSNSSQKYLLFEVPSDPDVLQKWRKSLSQKINLLDKVCEFHFQESDFCENLSTFSKLDEHKSLTFRRRVKLKLSAVPSPSMVRKDPLHIQKPNHLQKKEAGYSLEDVEEICISDESIAEFTNGSDRENCITIEVQSNNKQYQKQIKSDTTHQNECQKTGEQHVIKISYDDDPPEFEPVEQTKGEKIVSNYVKNGVVIKRVIRKSQSNNVNKQSPKVCQKRKSDDPVPAKKKISKPDVNTNSPEFIEKASRNGFSYSPNKHLENIDELKLIVSNRCIRSQWCVKIEEKAVCFSYVDFDKARVNCCLEIAEDFTVNAYTADRVIAIYVTTNDGVNCIAEIIEVMKVLEKKRWCLGPGLPLVNRSPNCIGAMPVKTLVESCTACIKEKLNVQAHTRELTTCRIKLDESRHKCELLRKKHHYATTQYERLKAENKILEYQVDEAKKVAINDVLNRLPPLQKQIVRYFINSSYTAKHALRYNTTWINECLVLRGLSPSAYEYLRSKEILPLPCPDTLKKHKFKINLEKDPDASDSNESFDYTKLPESPEVPNPDPLDVAEYSGLEGSQSIELPGATDADVLGLEGLSNTTTDMHELQSNHMPDLKEEVLVSTQEILESTEEVLVSTQEIPESTEEVPVSTEEVPESTEEVPESTQVVEMTVINDYPIYFGDEVGSECIVPECVASEEVAYEVTVTTETDEQQQY